MHLTRTISSVGLYDVENVSSGDLYSGGGYQVIYSIVFIPLIYSWFIPIDSFSIVYSNILIYFTILLF